MRSGKWWWNLMLLLVYRDVPLRILENLLLDDLVVDGL